MNQNDISYDIWIIKDDIHFFIYITGELKVSF